MARWVSSLDSAIQAGVFFDEPTNACWFVTADGEIQSFRILGQRLRRVGSGWSDAVSVLLCLRLQRGRRVGLGA